MRIAIFALASPRKALSPIFSEVVRLLREWGAEVDILHPAEQLLDVATVGVEYDLYILKSKTELTLSIAGILHAAGAAILNPYPVSATLRNKITTFQMLQAAGVPSPQTWVALRADDLAPLLREGPLVVKPYRGSGGEGVRVVWDAEELDNFSGEEEPMFAQRYHKPDGLDLKMYCIEGQVFGVQRVWPARTYEEKLGEPFTVPPELRDIALRCGEVFGIDLYGLDIIESLGRPYVVDVSSFPGFKGVPDAALRLADYIFWAAEHAAGEQQSPRRKVGT